MIEQQYNTCKCNTPPFHYADYDAEDFDTGNSIAEISLQTCKHCSNIWLKYLIEDPSHSGSGPGGVCLCQQFKWQLLQQTTPKRLYKTKQKAL